MSTILPNSLDTIALISSQLGEPKLSLSNNFISIPPLTDHSSQLSNFHTANSNKISNNNHNNSANSTMNIGSSNLNPSLTSSMMNLSLSNGLHSIQNYRLTLRNVPSDITLREAYAIFALSNDLISVEIVHEHSNVFEPTSGTSSNGEIQPPHQSQSQSQPQQGQDQAANSPSNQLHHPHHLQQLFVPVVVASFKSSISAQSIASILNHKQVFGPNTNFVISEYDDLLLLSNSTKSIVPSPSLNPSLSNLGIPQQQQQQQGQQQQQADPNNPPPELNNFNKRPSIVTQKSRFLFNDPFTGASNDGSPIMATSNIPQQQSLQQQPQQLQQQLQVSLSQQNMVPGAPQNAPPQLDLMAGKSLLMMEAQNDAMEYEQLVRWGSQPPPPTNPQPPQQFSLQLQQSDWDRRRTSSFYIPQLPQQQPPQQQQQQQQQQQLLQTQQQLPLQSQQQPQQQSQPSQPPSQQQPQQQQRPPLAHQLSNIMPPQLSTSSAPSSGPPSAGPASLSQLGQQSQPQLQQTAAAVADIPELSLLLRIPAPVNPADQNPPCNTLYVGNLPPDASELELRALFAPQQGFRRLSFRTKLNSGLNGSNSQNGGSSHNHGPMCFVEFEDVSLLTRALLELYGKLLPNRSLSGGKGIRLSFSKNPLGVRGPQRNNSQQSTQQVNGVSNGVMGGLNGSGAGVISGNQNNNGNNSNNGAGGNSKGNQRFNYAY